MFYLGIGVLKKSYRYLILNQEGKKTKSVSLEIARKLSKTFLNGSKIFIYPRRTLKKIASPLSFSALITSTNPERLWKKKFRSMSLFPS